MEMLLSVPVTSAGHRGLGAQCIFASAPHHKEQHRHGRKGLILVLATMGSQNLNSLLFMTSLMISAIDPY
jgi:hypothetical protein